MPAALTFPLTGLIPALKVSEIAFYQQVRGEQSGTQGGDIIAKETRSPLWYAKIQAGDLRPSELHAAQALIEAMGVSVENFYAWNPAQPGPVADFMGTALSVSTVTIAALDADNKRMTLAGLPAGYLLTVGDLVAFDYGGSRALHRLVQSVTASAGGTAQIEVRPHIRPGATVGSAVMLRNPAAVMKIVPGTYDPDLAQMTGRIAFEAIQII